MIRVVWWDLENRRGRPPSTSPVEVDLMRVLSLDCGFLSRIGMVVAELHNLQEEETRESLLSLLESRGRPPVLLLTRPEPDNIRLLPGLPVDDLAWTFEREEEVIARGIRLGHAPALERTRLGEYFLRFGTGCTTVESALKRVFLNPDPISTVRELARACFVCPRTLERRWNQSRPEGCRLTLKNLVDWGLLLRAWEQGPRGLSPHQVAKALGVHPRPKFQK